MKIFTTTLALLLSIAAVIFAVSYVLLLLAGIAPDTALIWNVLSSLDVNINLVTAATTTNSIYVFAASLLDSFIFALLAVVLAAVFFNFIKQLNLRNRFLLSRVRKLSQHVILVPYNNFSQALSKELQELGQPHVTVAKTEAELNRIYRQGMLGLIGNPESIDMFEVARIEEAKYVIACSDSDIENALITITAKSASARTRIISRVSATDNIAKLGSAGAFRMIMPEVTAGNEIGEELIKRMNQKQ